MLFTVKILIKKKLKTKKRIIFKYKNVNKLLFVKHLLSPDPQHGPGILMSIEMRLRLSRANVAGTQLRGQLKHTCVFIVCVTCANG